MTFYCDVQSLLLLAHLIKNGSERVVTSAREHLYDLRSLEHYHCVGKLTLVTFLLSVITFNWNKARW